MVKVDVVESVSEELGLQRIHDVHYRIQRYVGDKIEGPIWSNCQIRLGPLTWFVVDNTGKTIITDMEAIHG